MKRGAKAGASPTLQSLAALKSLQTQLKQRAQQREEEQQRRKAQALERDAAQHLFRVAVSEVTPLARPAVPTQALRPQAAPVPRQRLRDEQAALAESISDEFDAGTLLETDGELSYRRAGIGADVLRRLRRGDWALQDEIDLHGLRRDEAREALADFLRGCVRAGKRCVRVVHGKGLNSEGKAPVLKAKVRNWLVQKQEVIAFCQAKASEGGAGALIVLLQASQRPRA